MKRSSVLSRAYFRRPAVRELVPDLKLVLAVLTVGCESHIGVYRPAGLAEDTGLDSSALAGALDDLERRGHIVRDVATGELFLTAYFRDNSFANAVRRGQARDDFAQIESAALRARAVRAIEVNPSCGLGKNDLLKNHKDSSQGQGQEKGEGEGQAAAPRAHARGLADAAAHLAEQKRRSPRRTGHGLECWYPDEDAQADKIIQQYPAEQIAEAVKAIRQRLNGAGKPTSPVPRLVQEELDRIRELAIAAKQREAAEAAYRARLSSPPTAADVISDFAAKQRGEHMFGGEQVLARLRRKRSTRTTSRD